MGGKVFNIDGIGEITLFKRANARRLTIKVNKDGTVSASMPRWIPYKVALLSIATHKDQVMETIRIQRGRIEKAQTLRPLAREWLPERLALLAERYGFKYNKVFIKDNRSNWGSCSTKGNINLNLGIMRLPIPLRDYILLHELCHLRYMNHGTSFHDLLEKLCADNLLRLVLEKDPQAQEIMLKVVPGKTSVHRLMQSEVRRYRL